MLKHPDNAVNSYVQNYGLVIVMIDQDGRKVCYSSNYRNKLPEPFLDRVRSRMGVMPADTVLWADDVFKTPEPYPAREVVYGEKPEPPPKKPTRAQKRAQWAHPSPLNPEEINYLTGRSRKFPGN